MGRIEIQYNGVWGTVCNRNFDISSANVACRSLGFVAALHLVSSVSPGTGPIWLNNVRCFGNETSLEQCRHGGFGNNYYCSSHYYDVGVECLGESCHNIHRHVHTSIHIIVIIKYAST